MADFPSDSEPPGIGMPSGILIPDIIVEKMWDVDACVAYESSGKSAGPVIVFTFTCMDPECNENHIAAMSAEASAYFMNELQRMYNQSG